MPHLSRSNLLLFVTVFLAILPAPALALARSTADRPDDVTGSQIHFLYVLPSDGADRALDTNGKIATSVAAFARWLEKQSGGLGLRLDRFQGDLDITFFRLGRTDAQIASHGEFVRDEIERDLNAAGFHQKDKLYAVYYDGRSTFSCGGGFWPPDLPGNVVALYLHGEPAGAPPCISNSLASSRFSPGYLEFSMLHEIFHSLGAAARCAPHHTREGHVSDDPRDLMYAGDQPWQPSILDINHDDYFSKPPGHLPKGCLDLRDSAYLVQLPGKHAAEAAGSCPGASEGTALPLPPEHGIDACKHQLELAPRQLADAFGQMLPVDGDDQRDVRDRLFGEACCSRCQEHIAGCICPFQDAREWHTNDRAHTASIQRIALHDDDRAPIARA
jgi:hypothetical protein